MKKTTLKLSNFHKKNTPEKLEKIVNKLMLAGASVSAVALVLAAPPFGMVAATSVAAYAGSSVAIIKIISKLFGTDEVI